MLLALQCCGGSLEAVGMQIVNEGLLTFLLLGPVCCVQELAMQLTELLQQPFNCMAYTHTNACVCFAGLKPSDVSLMASISKLVPVIPLLAKVGVAEHHGAQTTDSHLETFSIMLGTRVRHPPASFSLGVHHRPTFKLPSCLWSAC